MRIAVVDGQGGGLGKAIIEKLLKDKVSDSVSIIALGTNGVATATMLRAGAREGASGENALVYNAGKVDVIAGSLSIILGNSMLGEVTPRMANAIQKSQALKFLIPVNTGGLRLLGIKEQPLNRFIEELIQHLTGLAGIKPGDSPPQGAAAAAGEPPSGNI